MGPRYPQHNPMAADGPGGFQGFLQFLRAKYPDSHSEITRLFADGEDVILRVHAVRKPGTRGSAIVDIFKLDNGKIVDNGTSSRRYPRRLPTRTGCFNRHARC